MAPSHEPPGKTLSSRYRTSIAVGADRFDRKAPDTVFEIRVTLRDVSPPIWRLLRVRGDISLDRLHSCLQVAMGWEDAHLHKFVVGDQSFSDPEFELNGSSDESAARLCDVANGMGATLRYLYDFGDTWEHDVKVVGVLDGDRESPIAICLRGKRACPPEDSGGTWGYQEKLAILSEPDPKDEWDQEVVDWIGADFNPEAFDKDTVNRLLQDI